MFSPAPRSSSLALAIVAAGCGSAGDEADGTIPPVTPVPTIAASARCRPCRQRFVNRSSSSVHRSTSTAPTAELIGDIVDGNRILMIGDSILASTSSRYGNQMCEAVVPLGWQVAVEAEPSRFVDFGNRVLDRVLPDDVAPDDDWDAAVVFLGSNYRGDAVRVRGRTRRDPRPAWRRARCCCSPSPSTDRTTSRSTRSSTGSGPTATTSPCSTGRRSRRRPGVLSSDRLHPTDAGRRVLAESVAAALGPVPTARATACARRSVTTRRSVAELRHGARTSARPARVRRGRARRDDHHGAPVDVDRPRSTSPGGETATVATVPDGGHGSRRR